MNYDVLYGDTGLILLFLLIAALCYASFSIDHLLSLEPGSKPSLWARPGIFLYLSLMSLGGLVALHRASVFLTSLFG